MWPVVCKRAHVPNRGNEGEGIPWFRKYYDKERGQLYTDPFIDTSISNHGRIDQLRMDASSSTEYQFSIDSLRGCYKWKGPESTTAEGCVRFEELCVITQEGGAVTLRRGEYVYLHPEQQHSQGKPWIARIEDWWEDQQEPGLDHHHHLNEDLYNTTYSDGDDGDERDEDDIDIRIKVRWMFRPEDTILQDSNSPLMFGDKELFLSTTLDENSIKSVVGKCHVLYLPPDHWHSHHSVESNQCATSTVRNETLSLEQICERNDAYFYRYVYNDTSYSFLDPHVEGNRDEESEERFKNVAESDREYWRSRKEKVNRFVVWDPSSGYPPSHDHLLLLQPME